MSPIRPLRAAALFAVLLLPCACAQSEPEPAPATSPVEAAQPEAEQPEAAQPEAEAPEAAQPEAPPADAETREMVLDPDELKASEDGSSYEYCLDCRRKSATYTYCEFDKVAFDAVTSSVAPGTEVSLTVEMVPVRSDNHTPDDPNAAQPDGGFTHNRHRCTVKAVKTTD